MSQEREGELKEAQNKVLELCARAEQYSQGLKTKLRARGFEPEVIREAIEVLAQKGIVDDLRYATIWARTRAQRKGEGPAIIAAGLRAKGLEAKIVKEALAYIDFGAIIPHAIEKEVKRLSKLLASGKLKGGEEFRDELYRSLKAQGFDAFQLKDALESYWENDK